MSSCEMTANMTRPACNLFSSELHLYSTLGHVVREYAQVARMYLSDKAVLCPATSTMHIELRHMPKSFTAVHMIVREQQA